LAGIGGVDEDGGDSAEDLDGEGRGGGDGEGGDDGFDEDGGFGGGDCCGEEGREVGGKEAEEKGQQGGRGAREEDESDEEEREDELRLIALTFPLTWMTELLHP